MEQSNDSNRDEGSNHQQITDSHHQNHHHHHQQQHHHHQQQHPTDMPVLSDHQQSEREHGSSGGANSANTATSANGQHKSDSTPLHDSANTGHMSGHQSDDNDSSVGHHPSRHAIIDAHTHVITEAPHTSAPSAHDNHSHSHQLKREGSSHSPSNIVDHSAHGSPVHELVSAATVGHSLDDKTIAHNDSALHSHLYGNYQSAHQQHHQSSAVIGHHYGSATSSSTSYATNTIGSATLSQSIGGYGTSPPNYHSNHRNNNTDYQTASTLSPKSTHHLSANYDNGVHLGQGSSSSHHHHHSSQSPSPQLWTTDGLAAHTMAYNLPGSNSDVNHNSGDESD
ncbi:unnamed protein product [Medioppia subpectinata]|uniref:Uncharacterized protein n=1 Tax=Medioppia subpectinata TaxID=1979941 RepID=A0A7R9KN70_9ACAR|nr:unnamed protein product [Medioppia subpectinata]CAG2105661.1 unnamed protein product [Medioppia subpectinata]